MLDDLLWPRTDAGVLVQVLTVFGVFAVALFVARRNRDLVIFLFGLVTLAAALMALRVLH